MNNTVEQEGVFSFFEHSSGREPSNGHNSSDFYMDNTDKGEEMSLNTLAEENPQRASTLTI